VVEWITSATYCSVLAMCLVAKPDGQIPLQDLGVDGRQY